MEWRSDRKRQSGGVIERKRQIGGVKERKDRMED